jgi:hypothetical protein
MTERQIQNALARDLKRWQVMMPNYTPFGWYECDLWGVTKAGYAVEFEIKVSVADFRADTKKGRLRRAGCLRGPNNQMTEYKHARLEQRDAKGPSRFFYVVPEGLIGLDELPDWAGLILISKYEDPRYAHLLIQTELQPAPKLHKHKADPKTIEHARGVCYYRYWNERSRRTA